MEGKKEQIPPLLLCASKYFLIQSDFCARCSELGQCAGADVVAGRYYLNVLPLGHYNITVRLPERFFTGRAFPEWLDAYRVAVGERNLMATTTIFLALRHVAGDTPESIGAFLDTIPGLLTVPTMAERRAKRKNWPKRRKGKRKKGY